MIELSRDQLSGRKGVILRLALRYWLSEAEWEQRRYFVPLGNGTMVLITAQAALPDKEIFTIADELVGSIIPIADVRET